MATPANASAVLLLLLLLLLWCVLSLQDLGSSGPVLPVLLESLSSAVQAVLTAWTQAQQQDSDAAAAAQHLATAWQPAAEALSQQVMQWTAAEHTQPVMFVKAVLGRCAVAAAVAIKAGRGSTAQTGQDKAVRKAVRAWR